MIKRKNTHEIKYNARISHTFWDDLIHLLSSFILFYSLKYNYKLKYIRYFVNFAVVFCLIWNNKFSVSNADRQTQPKYTYTKNQILWESIDYSSQRVKRSVRNDMYNVKRVREWMGNIKKKKTKNLTSQKEPVNRV